MGVRAQGRTQCSTPRLQEVNGWNRPEAEQELDRAWREYELRERYEWDLDLSALSGQITIEGYPDLYVSAAERSRLGNSYYR